jgi:hypothetical protein
MRLISPADELAVIRDRIARLKIREQDLRRLLLDASDEMRRGEHTRVEVIVRRIRLFDHRLLPDAIRDEPFYWREREVTDLFCRALDGRGPSRWVPPAPRAAPPARRRLGH